MARDKTPSQLKLPTRDRVLDAAERLLARGGAAFSMRELAEEAGVSFATPFNQFGSKAAIMLALSTRLIASMQEQLARASLPDTALARVLQAVDIAASVMLAAPAVNRAVMAAIGAPSDEPSEVSSRSAALWAEALADGEALLPATRPLAVAVIPSQLAIAFRGVLSFWTAGEIPDRLLKKRARAAAATVLLGFVAREDRLRLISLLEDGSEAKDRA
ncbi:MAG: helix-turn-helix domain-containing protein [Rhodospirillales bacterium]